MIWNLLCIALGFGDPTAEGSAAPAEIPGGDFTFSDLFRSDEGGVVEPTTAPQAEPGAPTTDPNAPATTPTATQEMQNAFELRTTTGTVYKSIEDAKQGIEHKDTLINQLRQFAIQNTGVDPLTGQQVSLPQNMQAPQGRPQAPKETSYLADPDAYFRDLYSAYEKNDQQAYLTVQQKLIDERTQAQFAPVMPLIQNMAKQSAIAQASSEVKEIAGFVGNQQYQETLQRFPSLAQAIAVSEQDFRYAQQLPDLYKMVYQLNQAARLPELIKQQTQAATPPQNNQPRPTAQPSHITPPPTTPQSGAPSNLLNPEARKSVIEAFEQSGKADMRWKK